MTTSSISKSPKGIGVGVAVGGRGVGVAVGLAVLVGSGVAVGFSVAVADAEVQATRNESSRARATQALALDAGGVFTGALPVFSNSAWHYPSVALFTQVSTAIVLPTRPAAGFLFNVYNGVVGALAHTYTEYEGTVQGRMETIL
jgi:hypothetical protein